MDFTSIKESTNDDGINTVILKDVKNFVPEHIFQCGQCFRWNRENDNKYIGIAFKKVLEVEKVGKDIILHNTNKEEFEYIWCEYFDLSTDYSSIKKVLSKDKLLKKSVQFGNGIRILNQDPFETIISFIISANNRIPMIKRCIENISKKFGEEFTYKGKKFYLFPNLDKMINVSEEELRECGTGFRGKYIKHTVKKLYNSRNNQNKEYDRNYDLNWVKVQNDDECHKLLQNFMGIGPKVADCIMLFSMKKHSAFPVDVWVRKAMQSLYLAPDVSLKKIRDFGRDKFGELSGFAQQYLFYYARENNIVG